MLPFGVASRLKASPVDCDTDHTDGFEVISKASFIARRSHSHGSSDLTKVDGIYSKMSMSTLNDLLEASIDMEPKRLAATKGDHSRCTLVLEVTTNNYVSTAADESPLLNAAYDYTRLYSPTYSRDSSFKTTCWMDYIGTARSGIPDLTEVLSSHRKTADLILIARSSGECQQRAEHCAIVASHRTRGDRGIYVVDGTSEEFTAKYPRWKKGYVDEEHLSSKFANIIHQERAMSVDEKGFEFTHGCIKTCELKKGKPDYEWEYEAEEQGYDFLIILRFNEQMKSPAFVRAEDDEDLFEEGSEEERKAKRRSQKIINALAPHTKNIDSKKGLIVVMDEKDLTFNIAFVFNVMTRSLTVDKSNIWKSIVTYYHDNFEGKKVNQRLLKHLVFCLWKNQSEEQLRFLDGQLASENSDESGLLLPTAITQNGIYLGCLTHAHPEVLKCLNISAILSVGHSKGADEAKAAIPDMNCLIIDLEDDGRSPAISFFESVCKFMDDSLSDGRKILVHCRKGVSRSPTMVMAYFIWKYRITLLEVFTAIRKLRVISPAPSLLNDLMIWEYKCLGRAHTLSIESCR